MCGIAGFVGLENSRLLRAMCDSLAHRGPDEEGFFTGPGVGLAHRRLSVIDLATGQQPMSNEDGALQVVFNGEIYNYQDLTAQLRRQGHTFRTTSDTETILHLYEEHGLDFLGHLRGMFAFALWDSKRRRLVLARDRIGEKPLYYMQAGNALLFGSEMKAILQRKQDRRVNAQAVCQLLAAGYVPAPYTMYQGIQKLPPAHMLVYEGGNVTVQGYWRRGCNSQNPISFRRAATELNELLLHTVGLCLRSDVEVGAFLSGGIDSSLIVALLREHQARVQTFAVGYEGEATGYNELQYARRVAGMVGSHHHEVILGANSSIDLLPRVLWHFDEPLGNPTSVLVYLLSKFAQRHLKVALGGTGADEIFFGYPRHTGIRLLQYYRLFPKFLRERFLERAILRWPESTKGSKFAKRAKQFVTGGRLSPPKAYLSWVSLLQRDVREELLSDMVKSEASDPLGEAFLAAYLTGRTNCELLDRAADLDVGAYLPGYQLTYMDRMSMAHGLEVRSPFCDYAIVDFVTSLPTAYRLKGIHSKHILKRIARQWMPREIAERKKVGFDSPFGQWVKGELRDFVLQFLSRENIDRSGLLNYEGVMRVLADHLGGRRNYSLQLWTIVCLEAWYRMYIEDEVTDGLPYRLRDLRGALGRRASHSGGPPPTFGG